MPDQFEGHGHPESPFGDTAPCLKMSQAYGISYGLALSITDNFLRSRSKGVLSFADEINALPIDVWRNVCEDARSIANRTQSMWEYGDRERKLAEHDASGT